jgi:hypothetical protein
MSTADTRRPVIRQAGSDLDPLAELLTGVLARTRMGHHSVADERIRGQMFWRCLRIIVPHAMTGPQVDVLSAKRAAAIWYPSDAPGRSHWTVPVRLAELDAARATTSPFADRITGWHTSPCCRTCAIKQSAPCCSSTTTASSTSRSCLTTWRRPVPASPAYSSATVTHRRVPLLPGVAPRRCTCHAANRTDNRFPTSPARGRLSSRGSPDRHGPDGGTQFRRLQRPDTAVLRPSTPPQHPSPGERPQRRRHADLNYRDGRADGRIASGFGHATAAPCAPI